MTPNQSAALKTVGVLGAIFLVGYFAINRWREGMEREAAETAARREQELQLAAAQNSMLEQMGQGDTKTVQDLVDACIDTARGPSVIYMLPDRKDPIEVRKHMKRYRTGRDVSDLVAYLDLPEMDERAFLLSVAQQALQRVSASGESHLEFALTYEFDSFAGMRKGSGIMTCPLRGGQPHEPGIEELYEE